MTNTAIKLNPPPLEFKILLVEDDEVYVIYVHEIVRNINLDGFNFSNFTVAVCKSIKQAKEALLLHTYDVILLDLMLPDAIGLEGLKYLIDTFSDTPIVIHSQIYSKDLAAEAISIGAQDFIIKDSMAPEDFARTLLHAKLRHDNIKRLQNLKYVQ